MNTGARKTKIGRVVGNHMNKTVVVRVEWKTPHPIYKKSVRKFSKFYAHDEQNIGIVGDWVRITETRPLSKTKRWQVADVLTRKAVIETNPSEIGVPEEAISIVESPTDEEEKES